MTETKTLNETFGQEEFQALTEIKGERTWHDAILEEFGVMDNE